MAVLLATSSVALFPSCKRNGEGNPPPPAPDEVTPLAKLAEAPAVEHAAPAKGPAPTGWIAFVRESHEVPETWIVRPDGSDPRRLPLPPGSTGAFPGAPLPDGSALLGVAVQELGEHHAEQLVVWSLGAKRDPTVRSLGPSSGRTRNPVPSPDGKRLAFESGASSFSDLYLIDLDGQNLRRITENAEGNFEPVWSPDGTQLAFTSSRDGDPEIYRMAADGTGQERLTAFHLEDGSPKWSRDGKHLAFLSNREGADAIFLMQPDGTGQRRVLPAPAKANTEGAGEFSERDAAWSPDGRTLALVRPGAGGKAAIHLVDVRSGVATALTDGKARDDQPVFSPDGRHLAFVSDRTGTSQIWVMRTDGSGQRQLTRSEDSDWRPVWVPGSSL